MSEEEKPKIIYGVLNWGLGHATRSIPIIKLLEKEGYEPIIASDGEALRLLGDVFPHLQMEELPSYAMRYARKMPAILAVILQTPRMWSTTIREHKHLQKLVKKYKPAGLISDNRLGFYHSKLPGVYITHQLKVMLPFFRTLVSSWHHRYIKRFSECWIPDHQGEQSLSGEMTRNMDPDVPTYFIGPRSQLEGITAQPKEELYNCCVILSGPEPQRSVLEKKLYMQLSEISGSHLFVRGLKNGGSLLPSTDNMEVVDFMNGDDLARVIRNSELVISRSGYSSIMDYQYLGNSALLIPTPGQPEQEYLARYMLSKGWFFYADQERLHLKDAIPKALAYKGLPPTDNEANEGLLIKRLSLFKGE